MISSMSNIKDYQKVLVLPDLCSGVLYASSEGHQRQLTELLYFIKSDTQRCVSWPAAIMCS